MVMVIARITIAAWPVQAGAYRNAKFVGDSVGHRLPNSAFGRVRKRMGHVAIEFSSDLCVLANLSAVKYLPVNLRPCGAQVKNLINARRQAAAALYVFDASGQRASEFSRADNTLACATSADAIESKMGRRHIYQS